MPQSFCQLYGHLVFSTKLRHRWLDANIRADVHGYLAGALRKMECADIHIGGTDDHVHALFLLSKKVAPATLVQELKQESSKHIKTLSPEHGNFAWQRGYALFSVSPTASDAVRRYVDNQEEHHRHTTFQDELRELLKKAGLEFDERYLWD